MPLSSRPGNVEIARSFRAARQHHGVKFLAQILRGNAAANVSVRLESDSLGHHLFEAPVENALFQFEVRDAVAQQAADAVILFKQGDFVARAIQLLRGGEARRARTDDGNSLPGARLGRFRLDPAFFPCAVDDGFFDQFDRDGRFVDPQDARRFAWRGANAPGKLRKIISGMEDADRILPAVAIDEIVPVRNDVVDRAARVAERNAAIHAARALHAHFFFRERLVDLEIIVNALRDRTPRRHFTRVFLEAGDLTHESPGLAREWFRPAPPRRSPGFAECPGRVCIRAGTP